MNDKLCERDDVALIVTEAETILLIVSDRDCVGVRDILMDRTLDWEVVKDMEYENDGESDVVNEALAVADIEEEFESVGCNESVADVSTVRDGVRDNSSDKETESEAEISFDNETLAESLRDRSGDIVKLLDWEYSSVGRIVLVGVGNIVNVGDASGERLLDAVGSPEYVKDAEPVVS